MIKVRHLTHRFGEKTVLQDVSLDVEVGEIVAVMGSSGGGKTTLLRCMSGLMRPTSGTVEVFGIDLYTGSERRKEEARRKLGVVFQSAALFDYLNVFDNVSFGLVRNTKMSRAEVEKRVSELLEMVGLVGSEALFPGELSGGMRKRVGVARALASEPEVLFYDEPTSGLDPVITYALDGLIKEVAERTGATSIVISHDLNSVLRVADRVLFLESGHIIANQTPPEFHENPDPRIREIISKAETQQMALQD